MLAPLVASLAIALAPEYEPVAVSTKVEILSDRIEFTTEFDDTAIEKEAFFFPFAQEAETTTIDDCVASAQIACGTHGIKWLRFRTNPTTGEVSCEFECNPGTGSGG